MPLRTAAEPVGAGEAVRGSLAVTMMAGGRCLNVAGDRAGDGGAGTGNVVDCSDCPQLWQKRASSLASVPHWEQNMPDSLVYVGVKAKLREMF